MIVVNKDGAGGLIGTNYTYAAKPDGLTMAMGINNSLIGAMLARDPAAKFDLKKMNWIEYTNPEGYAFGVGAKSPYASMESVSKVNGFKFASSSRTSTGSIGAGLIIELFGLKDAKIVLGYGGAAEAMLALAKGEVDAYVTTNVNFVDGMSKGFTKQPFVVLDFQRSAYLPDVRAIPELLKLSPAQDDLLRTFVALRAGQVYWLPPGVPQDRIDFVCNAFDKIVTMDGFLKQSASRWAYVPPVSGKDYAAAMEKTLAAATPERYNELQALADKYQ